MLFSHAESKDSLETLGLCIFSCKDTLFLIQDFGVLLLKHPWHPR